MKRLDQLDNLACDRNSSVFLSANSSFSKKVRFFYCLIDAENLKKKQELMKLRDDKKTTKKARAMATRTKDNLKVKL